MVLKLGNFRKEIRNTWESSKCGDGEDQLNQSFGKWGSITVKEETDVLHVIKRRKAKWIVHILYRNCLLKHVIEGKIGVIEVTGRQEKM
jgi:hypothetical protein